MCFHDDDLIQLFLVQELAQKETEQRSGHYNAKQEKEEGKKA